MRKIWNDRVYRIYLFTFLKDFSFFTAVLVPFFTDWGHLVQSQIQIIQSWFSLWVFILEVPTGAVADKIGRKHSITLGSLVVGCAVLVYGSVPRFEIFLLAEFMFAIGVALMSGADQALLYDTLKEEGREEESKKIIGRNHSIHLLSMLLVAPIGSLIAAKFGVNAPMLATAVPFFAAAIVGWTITEPKIHSKGSESPKYMDIVKKGFGAIRTNHLLRTLAIDSVLVSAAAYFVIWLYQPILMSLKVPVAVFGFIHAGFVIMQMSVTANFVLFEKLVGSEKRYLQLTALATTVGFVLVALWPDLWTVFLFIVLAGGFGITRSTYITSIAQKHIDSGERATVLSSISMIRRFALVLLNPIIGLVADQSLQIALLVVGILPLGALMLGRSERAKD